MARIRTIKPEFFTSDDTCGLSPMARLLYIGLWCEADRAGRMVWAPKVFRRRYLPDDECDILALCQELVSRGLVVLYGDGLAFIPTFEKHQHLNPRESASKLPVPDASARVTDATVTHREEGKGREGKREEERREPKLTLVTAEPVPPAAAAVAATVQESIFRSGVAYLVSTGTGEAIARSQLGKLRQIAQGAAGGDRDRGDVILLDCLGEAERQGIINPFPWLSKAVLARTVSKPDPDSDLSWMDRKVFV